MKIHRREWPDALRVHVGLAIGLAVDQGSLIPGWTIAGSRLRNEEKVEISMFKCGTLAGDSARYYGDHSGLVPAEIIP